MVQLKAIRLCWNRHPGHLPPPEVDDFIARFITLNTLRINPGCTGTHEIKISPFVSSAGRVRSPRPPPTLFPPQDRLLFMQFLNTIYFNLLLPLLLHCVRPFSTIVTRIVSQEEAQSHRLLYSLYHCLWKPEKFNDYSLRNRLPSTYSTCAAL